MEMTDGEIARRALEILDGGRRWVKSATRTTGIFYGPERMCIASALYEAATGVRSSNATVCAFGIPDSLIDKIYDAARERGWHGGASLVGFNDSQGTTWDDIRVVLEKVAAEG